MWGKLFGDKGYINRKLTVRIFREGLYMVTRIKKNMKNKLIRLADNELLDRRGVIESVIDILKNIFLDTAKLKVICLPNK